MALNNTKLKSVKAKNKPYTVNDLDGLSIYIACNERKSWHFRFQFHGKGIRISLGTYPEISLQDARALRDEARSLVARGIDPRVKLNAYKKQNPPEDTNVITFKRFANEEWVVLKFKKLYQNRTNIKKRQSTKEQVERYLKKDILPILGHIPISDITRQDVLEVQRKIEQRNALSIAEKCRSWLNELFRHAMVMGLIDHNPAADMDIIALPQKPTEHNPFLQMDELPELLEKLERYQGSWQTIYGIKLLLLTGVRTGELRFATPDQFDLEKQLWFIPPDAVKQLQSRVRNSSKKIPPYIVPLSKQATSLIKELLDCSYSGQKYLLCHRTQIDLPISENTLNGALKRMGFKDRQTGHGLRATLSTALNEQDYQKKWIEAQLSHSDKDTTSASYNHAEYVEQRKKMMQEWADRLDEMISK